MYDLFLTFQLMLTLVIPRLHFDGYFRTGQVRRTLSQNECIILEEVTQQSKKKIS